MTEADLKNALLNSQLPHKELLASLARPAIHALATPVEDEEVPVGASRIGGLPDLPTSLAWPMWRETPHYFLAQINLEELPYIAERHLLPAVGHLFFFCELEWGFVSPNESDWPESWRVLYSADPPVPMTAEEGAAARAQWGGWLSASLRLTFSEFWTVPHWDSIWCQLPTEESEIAWELMDGFYDAHDMDFAYRHQLFGFTNYWPDDAELQCEMIRRGARFQLPPESLRPEIEEAAKDWLLLFQINDESKIGSFTFGDLGTMHYWIRKCDLERHDFAAVFATMGSF